ncbi:hypothetical protein QZH41_017028 [Actinostola sp. cb2023]|nr:hypothetical protein QZH41_017028 [Actinostola sp. cb2023]
MLTVVLSLVLEELAATITTPKCTWEIQGPHSATIKMFFRDFDVEPSKNCIPYDSVIVRENCNGTWSNNLAGNPDVEAYCGNRTEFNITSNCGRVRIEFKSDDSVTGKGFNVSYQIHREFKKPVIIRLGQGYNDTQEEIAESDIQIDCVSDGYPPPKIFWSRDNGPLPGNRRAEYNGTLRLFNIRESDSGNYECFTNNSMGSDSKKVKLDVKEKCTCPKYIKTNWYSLPPYMKGKDEKSFKESLFMLLLEQIFQRCCGNCSNGHGPSKILFTEPNSQKASLVEVKNNIKTKETISFPIPGKKDDNSYQSFKFLSVVSSPGIAFIVVNAEPGSSARAVFNSVLGGWPILLLTMIMALLSGMIMWALDTWYNPDEFPRSFIKGSGEGFWWAFVTMTTVGYGDRSPRGYLARIFAIIWVLVGIVITSIFTGVVTTSLTAITLSTDTPLYGTSIIAIANSTEYKLGLNKNANMSVAGDLKTLAAKLLARSNKGALVDTYVAGEEKAFNNTQLRVSKIIDYDSHYGIVFGDEPGQPLAKGTFQTCLQDYVAEKKADFYKIIEKNTKPLEKPKESQAVERSSGLFDADSELFKSSVFVCLGLFLFLAACGIIWDYGYMRRWRAQSGLDELEMIGGPSYEIAKRNMDMMDSMMAEVQEFYDNWNRRLDEMTQRHEDEHKLVSKYQSK